MLEVFILILGRQYEMSYIFQKKRNLIIISVYALLFIVCNLFFHDGDFSISNIIIAIFSIFLFVIGFDGFTKAINASNTFLTFFYFGLALNCLELSGLQTEKKVIDIYFYFVGPLVFVSIIRLIERVKFRKLKRIKPLNIKGEYIALLVFVIYLVLKLMVFKTTGIKYLDSNFSMSDNSEYAVTGVTGVCNMFMLMSLMFLNEQKGVIRVIIIGTVLLFECVFMVSRGQLIKVFAFLLMYFLLNQDVLKTLGKSIYEKTNKVLSKRNKRIIVIVGVAVLLAFSYMGQYRQSVRSNGVYNILTVTDLKINSIPLAWFYSYYPLNFEVIREYYGSSMTVLGYPSTILMPIVRLVLNDSQAYIEMMNASSKLHINGFNAATFLSRYILDFGYFYFIELAILALYIGVVEKIAINRNAKGVYAFLLSLVLLYSFGDYSMVAYYVLAIVAMLILYTFVIKENKQ